MMPLSILDLVGQRHVAGPDGFGDKDAFLVGQVEKFLGLGCIGRKCLLDEAGLAVLQGQTGVCIVMRVRRGDIDKIYIWILDESLVGIVNAGTAVTRSKSLRLL